MKFISILFLSFWAFSAAGQIKPMNKKDAEMPEKIYLNPPKRYKKVVNDSVPEVVYVNTENIGRQPAIYINGEFINPTIIKTIDPKFIDSLYIENKEIEIENKKYFGQIFIKMKKEYDPQFISLTDLKKKFTNLANNNTIFMIDNDIIKEDYDHYLVDEKYILKIIVDTIQKENVKLNTDIIRLLTRTKENIKKSKEIRIRGLNEII